MEENKPLNETPEATRPKRRLFNPFQVLNGEFLQKEKVLKHLPFLFFLAFLAAIYIANKYYGENKVRQINQLSNQLKESHSEFIASKVLLTEKCKQTQVEQNLTALSVKVSVVPPKVIKIDQQTAKVIF